MTELQKVEFDILKRTVEICESLGLTYFLVCGSALGAVKYHGFIPWDDDVDIALPRADYETFCEKAQSMLPENLFLQNYKTDSYPSVFTKIRNSGTTFIERSVASLPVNHGVYIDVFPLDEYPKGRVGRAVLEVKKKYYNGLLSSVFCTKKSGRAKIYGALGKILRAEKKIPKLAAKLERTLAFKGEGSGVLCNHANWQGKLEYAPREQYGAGTEAEFEGLRVRIPERYDEYLTQKYGDWRSDLPEEEKVGHHFCEVCDTTRPYKEYVEHLPDGGIKIKSDI